VASVLPDVTMVSDVGNVGVKENDPGTAFVVTIYGEHLGKRFEITHVPLIIGRSSDCAVHVLDDSVSRKHCKIMTSEKNIVVMDLKSTNGTYVNSTAVSVRHLKNGDIIQVGRSIFKFLVGDDIESAYHEEIYRLKTVDGLTGAYNKRTFDEELQRELHRFYRYNRPLSLVMFDIDHFKDTNDTFGHLAGDRVLSEIGVLMGEACRKEDTFCRYGGEEFAILMPEFNLKQGISFADEIRLKVEAHLFEFDGAVIPITISGGVAEADPGFESPSDFIAVADTNLYEAKRTGRNRIMPT
jgi:two-component system cell cycle response regulator